VGDFLFVVAMTAIVVLLGFVLHDVAWFFVLLVLGCVICWRRLGSTQRRHRH
jgi:type II secretory pathway component PulF